MNRVCLRFFVSALGPKKHRGAHLLAGTLSRAAAAAALPTCQCRPTRAPKAFQMHVLVVVSSIRAPEPRRRAYRADGERGLQERWTLLLPLSRRTT